MFSNVIVDKEFVFNYVVWTTLIFFAWEFYLSYRQRRVYQTKKEMPNELFGIMKKETYEKARLYGLDKSYYEVFHDLFNLSLGMLIIVYNGHKIMWDIGGGILKYFDYNPRNYEILQSMAYILVSNIFNSIVKLPFTVYYTFVLEEKHGFNKQTAWFFIKDVIKSFIVSQIAISLIVAGIIYIVKIGGDYFFVYLWLFAIAVTVFFLTIYPDFIAPLFDKYTPLEEGELRTEIERLADGLNFPLKKLYVVEGSKRSAHSNAYFYGFYKNKRIVLFDTLLKKEEGENAGKGCSNTEVLAVLGHELGHWKLNHVLKNFIIMQVNMFLVFFVFKTMFRHQPLYTAFGFEDSTPVLIGFTIQTQYILNPYFSLISCALARVSRSFEFAADQFAKSLGRCYSLKAALIKLNTENLGFPVYDPWFSTWHLSHPPLLERLQALEETDKKD